MRDVRVVGVIASHHGESLLRTLRGRGLEAEAIRGNGRVAVFLMGRFLGRSDGVSRWEADVPPEISPGVHEVDFFVKIMLGFKLPPRGRRTPKTPPDAVALSIREERSGKVLYPELEGAQQGIRHRCASHGARLVMLSRIGGEPRDIWICEYILSGPTIVDCPSKRFVVHLEQRTPFYGPLSSLPQKYIPCAGEAGFALARGAAMSLVEADRFLQDMRPFASWQTAP